MSVDAVSSGGSSSRLARAGLGSGALRSGRLALLDLDLHFGNLVLDGLDDPLVDVLGDAADVTASVLEDLHGALRVFDDAHPALGDWARQVLDAPADAARAGPLAAPMRAPTPVAEALRLRSQPSMALTPKEREVLELLTRNLSNKEIGLAMQVGEATIKWHMKNLFAKLDAGTRKQVVQRARILGLLEGV